MSCWAAGHPSLLSESGAAALLSPAARQPWRQSARRPGPERMLRAGERRARARLQAGAERLADHPPLTDGGALLRAEAVGHLDDHRLRVSHRVQRCLLARVRLLGAVRPARVQRLQARPRRRPVRRRRGGAALRHDRGHRAAGARGRARLRELRCWVCRRPLCSSAVMAQKLCCARATRAWLIAGLEQVAEAGKPAVAGLQTRPCAVQCGR